MISVIVPTLNEGLELPITLGTLRESTAPYDLVVVDAGSRDDTVAIAQSVGARVIASPVRQRAHQLNLGAAAAKGEFLLFLHADTHLPPGALDHIQKALTGPADGSPGVHQPVGGGFVRHFDSSSRLLRLTCRLAAWRCRRWGWFLGDQGIFVRRTTFQRLGGFREIALFEDLDFSRRLARSGPVVTLSPGVVTSARRFAARGALVTTLRDLWLTIQYLAGRDPDKLRARITPPKGPKERE